MRPRPSVLRLALAAALVSLASAAASPAMAQEPDYQQWLQLALDGRLDRAAPGLRLQLELNARRGNAPRFHETVAAGYPEDRFVESPNTVLLFRPAVGYAFAPWGSVWLGYGWTPNFFDDPEVRGARNVDEHRIWEQLLTSHPVGPLTLVTRTRVEQRVRTNGPGSAENDAGLPHWAHRIRLQARLVARLRAGRPWIAVLSDELFLHLNRTGYPTEAGFDQNRLFVGPGYTEGAIRVELGYMFVYVRRFTDEDQANHVLSAVVALALGG